MCVCVSPLKAIRSLSLSITLPLIRRNLITRFLRCLLPQIVPISSSSAWKHSFSHHFLTSAYSFQPVTDTSISLTDAPSNRTHPKPISPVSGSTDYSRRRAAGKQVRGAGKLRAQPEKQGRWSYSGPTSINLLLRHDPTAPETPLTSECPHHTDQHRRGSTSTTMKSHQPHEKFRLLEKNK